MSWGTGNQPYTNPQYQAGAGYGQSYGTPTQQAYGVPPQQAGRPPPQQQGGYGAPPQQAYGAPPPQQAYGAPPPPAQQGYGAPPSQYGAPPQQYGTPAQGYGVPPPQSHPGYGGAPGYGGGYGAGPPPPPGVDPKLWDWFRVVDVDGNGKITADELRQVLLNGNWSPFNPETCRLMIGMFDRNKDGTIDVHEFAALWKYIDEWKNCFDKFDLDRSGNIDAGELLNAFRTFGYQLSMDFCRIVVSRFDRRGVNTINFDDFIQCCVMLRSLTESFKQKDAQKSGWITVAYEEFLHMVLENTTYH